jgi:ethanolamine ammonia-lyase small subunit
VPDATPTRRPGPDAPPAAPLATTSTTSARIALGSTGPAIPVREHLRFQLDHAQARDAVHTPLDIQLLLTGLQARNLQGYLVRSGVDAMFSPNAPAADLRRTYLRRPDLGRTLHPNSVLDLQQLAAHNAGAPGLASETWDAGAPGLASETWDAGAWRTQILFLLADGLSALALERHALPLLDATLPLIPNPCSLIPVVQNARVAIADQIGHLLHAQITVLLIGERPGLSSPDSLGCYITWAPRPGRTDAERNCISNIRGPEGLSYTEAAHRIAHYIAEAQRLNTSGIALKDPDPTLTLPISARNPL